MKILKKAILIIFLLSYSVSSFSQTYQPLYTNYLEIKKFISHEFIFDSKSHVFFQLQQFGGAPCLIDSHSANTYILNTDNYNFYQPYNNFFERLICNDPFMENCWSEPVDIVSISNTDSNFIISHMQTEGGGLVGNCVTPIRSTKISYDGGLTYTFILQGLKINAIEIDPSDDDIIYSGSENNIYKSTDRGISFSIISNVNSLTNLLKVSPFNSSNVFTSSASGMYISTNGGASFSSLGIPSFNQMHFIANTPLIYGAGSNGVYRSSDNGLNWIRISGINSVCIETDPDNNSIIYIGTNSGVYRSLNNGQTFNKSGINFPLSNQIIGLVKDPDSGDTLIVCTKNGIYKVWDLLTSVAVLNNSAPEKYFLSKNFPNPFNPVTNIEFGIIKQGFVALKISDVLGNEVTTLVNEMKSAGSYRYQLSAADYDMPSGIYFYSLYIDGSLTDTKRMMLLK
ncbi:MAG: T9SS type A sorting domain-containing protein [Ignavibacteria bacterium]|nr:T9SS type A sorting domain-containing protein [Ignavibacteria bacterium]